MAQQKSRARCAELQFVDCSVPVSIKIIDDFSNDFFVSDVTDDREHTLFKLLDVYFLIAVLVVILEDGSNGLSLVVVKS